MQGKNGNLTGWAKQGVFLLNAILTVRAYTAASHSKIGWTTFTDSVIKAISDNKEGVVFMLWGNFARSKKPSSTLQSILSWKPLILLRLQEELSSAAATSPSAMIFFRAAASPL